MYILTCVTNQISYKIWTLGFQVTILEKVILQNGFNQPPEYRVHRILQTLILCTIERRPIYTNTLLRTYLRQSRFYSHFQIVLCTCLYKTRIMALYAREKDRLNSCQKTTSSSRRDGYISGTRILTDKVALKGNFILCNIYFTRFHHRFKRGDKLGVRTCHLFVNGFKVFLLLPFIKCVLTVKPLKSVKTPQILYQLLICGHKINKLIQIVKRDFLKASQFFRFHLRKRVELSTN